MTIIKKYKCDFCCTIFDDNSELSASAFTTYNEHACGSCAQKLTVMFQFQKDAMNRLGNVPIGEILADMSDAYEITRIEL